MLLPLSELDPSTAGKNRFHRAIEYEKTGDYIMAMQEYATLSHESPPFRPALVNLGSLYSRMKRFDDALHCYQKAVEMTEDYLTWFNIGSIYYRQNEYKQAVIALEKAKRLNNGFVLAVLVMGLSYRRLANLKAAEHCFKEVLSLSGENEVALTGLTMLFFDSGKFHQALETADQLLALKPENFSIQKLRSNILYGLGRTSDSAEAIKELRENDKGYRSFDDFVESIPSDIFDDKFGGITNKIETLEEKVRKSEKPEDMMALSLCYLFKGESDRAIDCLFKVRDFLG